MKDHTTALKALNIIILTILINLSVFISPPLSARSADGNPQLFSGKTMGTTYHIKVVMHDRGGNENIAKLNSLIEEKLKQVNHSMSVYAKDSEISIFNSAAKGEKIAISDNFFTVITTSQKLYKITDGAWDGTVKPLVDLWGFGTKKERSDIPSEEEINAYLQTVGFNEIEIGDRTLQKKISAVTLDLGSIAKGFGVDAVASVLKDQGYTDFLVEIGGEVIASGEKAPGKEWMVGISRPEKGENPDALYSTLPLKNMALATSGDYRNFTIVKGKSYSHIIDPKTGYPVNNGVVSTSVISDTCTFADGLATALMVMGPKKGIKLVDSIEGCECMIIVEEKNGALTEYRSRNFKVGE